MGNPVVHFDIGCRDLERSRNFYTSLFDWSDESYGPLSKKLRTEAQRGIEGHLTSLGHEPHNYVMIYVEVDDVVAYASKVESLGGSVVIPETAIPSGGTFAWIKDPDENLIGLYNPQGSVAPRDV